jgi:predicted TIM-barrel fold metal-dependent hydrolase
MGLGFAVASDRWELLVVLGLLILAVFLPVMRREAAELAARFPQAYADYAESVPLFFPKAVESGGVGAKKRFSWSRVRKNREHDAIVGWALVVCFLWWKMS